MAKNVRTTEAKAIVNIDGEKTPFLKLRISQELGEHHDFEVLVDYKTFDEKFHESPEKFLAMTNTKVVIDIWHADRPENTYVFSGMITNTKMQSRSGAHGAILFVGKGKTIELDRGKNTRTFSQTNLRELFNMLTGGTVNLDVIIDPEWMDDIDFLLQYRESDWDFFRRVCAIFHERYAYLGTQLHIGPHREFKTIEMVYDKDLSAFEVCSRLIPNQFSTYYYKREEDKVWEQDAPGSIENATNLLQVVSKRSDNLNLLRKPKEPTAAYVPDMGSFIEHTKRRKVSEGGKMMYITAKTALCDVRLGRKVHISMPPNMGGTDMGTYRVYKIFHELDQNGRYNCEFEALPADLEYTPTSEIRVPTPMPIEGIIWSNNPTGSGYVRVEFPFDERICETWMPVMSFSAGGAAKGSGNVTVNRGAIFLPEVGDRCLVSFLDGQTLSHPFVMGSMYHGKITDNQGGGMKNDIKSLITKSGHTVKLDDTKGKEFIQIYDKKNNLVEIDTAEDTINIFANSTINLTAVDVNIMAKRSFNVTAGMTISQQSGIASTYYTGGTTLLSSLKDTQFKAGKSLTAKGGKDVDIASGASAFVKLNAKGNTDIQGKKKVKMVSNNNIEINGNKKVKMTSKETVVEGKKVMSMKGKKIKNN